MTVDADDLEELGIPAGADVSAGQNRLANGWLIEWIGVRLYDAPKPPWPWPYYVLSDQQSGRPWWVVQLWRQTAIHLRTDFQYSIVWHPEHGRSYHVNSADPEFSLLREAQRALLKDARGRRRHRPRNAAEYTADFNRIRKDAGAPPSVRRMADEYGVKPDTVARWLRSPEWKGSVPMPTAHGSGPSGRG